MFFGIVWQIAVIYTMDKCTYTQHNILKHFLKHYLTKEMWIRQNM